MEEVYKQLSVVLRLRKYFRTMLELEWNNIVCLVKRTPSIIRSR